MPPLRATSSPPCSGACGKWSKHAAYLATGGYTECSPVLWASPALRQTQVHTTGPFDSPACAGSLRTQDLRPLASRYALALGSNSPGDDRLRQRDTGEVPLLFGIATVPAPTVAPYKCQHWHLRISPRNGRERLRETRTGSGPCVSSPFSRTRLPSDPRYGDEASSARLPIRPTPRMSSTSGVSLAPGLWLSPPGMREPREP
jgi:hypothetical protein